VQYSCTQTFRCSRMRGERGRSSARKWLFFRSGQGASNNFEAGGFVRSHDDVAYPTSCFTSCRCHTYDGTSPAGDHGYKVHVGTMYSTSAAGEDHPRRNPRVHSGAKVQLYVHDQDRREWLEAVRVRAGFLTQPAFDPSTGARISPGPDGRTEAEDADGVAATPKPRMHPSCSVAGASTSGRSSIRTRWGCGESTMRGRRRLSVFP